MNGRGFTVADVAASVACLALLGAVLTAGAESSRQKARSAASQAQLRWIAGVTASYAADHQDKLWGFSWTKDTTPGAETDVRAAALQAQDIMHRRVSADFRAATGWLCTRWYSHLPLADYLDIKPPMFNFVAPEDAVRLAWARDPDGFLHGEYLPLQPEPIWQNYRWVYSSSYQVVPQFVWDPISGPDAPRAYSQHWTMIVPLGARLTQRRVSDIAFPAQKVHLHAGEQWAPRRIFFGDPAATVAMLMGDASAAANRTDESNLGWRVQSPGWLFTYERYEYVQRSWEAPLVTALPRNLVAGRYDFTRAAHRGRDFDGPEIDIRGP